MGTWARSEWFDDKLSFVHASSEASLANDRNFRAHVITETASKKKTSSPHRGWPFRSSFWRQPTTTTWETFSIFLCPGKVFRFKFFGNRTRTSIFSLFSCYFAKTKTTAENKTSSRDKRGESLGGGVVPLLPGWRLYFSNPPHTGWHLYGTLGMHSGVDPRGAQNSRNFSQGFLRSPVQWVFRKNSKFVDGLGANKVGGAR